MKQRILFIFVREKSYSSASVRLQPSGGTEKSVIFLAEALHALGFHVDVATCWEEYAGCRHLSYDFVIAQEAVYFTDFPQSKKIWWTHQFSDQQFIQRNLIFVRMFADHVVYLSQCQADNFQQMLNGIPSSIIGHGLWKEEVAPAAEKVPYSLIYASTPYRGLHLMKDMFLKIKEFQPQATLTVCSSMKTYGMPDQDVHYQALFDDLSQVEGITLTGSQNQAELYGHLAKSALFLYPCTHIETYCILLDEAIAHGCIPIINNVGALPDRFPYAGTNPDELVAFVKYLFDHPKIQLEHFKRVHQPLSWMEIAMQWKEQALCGQL